MNIIEIIAFCFWLLFIVFLLIINVIIMYPPQTSKSYRILKKLNKRKERMERKKERIKMTKKEMLEEINELKYRFSNQEYQLIMQKEDFRKFKENIKIRDYLIKTKFVGKLKNKELIKDFKKEKYNYGGIMFTMDEIINSIKNYDFYIYNYFFENSIDVDYIETFNRILKKYEEKQATLDKYCESKKKK